MLVYPTVRRFFAADTGAGASGAGGGAASDPNATIDPFKDLNLDDLDPDTRKVVEASKTTFANLQADIAKRAEKEKKLEELARNFQSKTDALTAQLEKLKGTTQPPNPNEVRAKKVEELFIKRGVPPDVAKTQAPLFAEMFGELGEELKGQIGRDLAPLGTSVMQGEATRAWQQALTIDKLGALQNPQIAQKAWESVQQMVQAGQPVTAETIINLRNIYYTEHLETNGQVNPPMNPNNTNFPPMPNFGPPGFSGGGHSPTRPITNDPNAPKHKLNEDTAAALAAVQRTWGIKPKGGK